MSYGAEPQGRRCGVPCKQRPLGVRSFSRKTLSILISAYKMENYDTLRMPELHYLMRGHRLRNYSRLRKDKIIALLWDAQSVVKAHNEQRPLPLSSPPQRHTATTPRCPLGNQIKVLLGNWNINHKLKPDNPRN